MSKSLEAIGSFIKRESVLCISGLAAAISCFFVPPSRAYFNYIDFRTLALLYCLMVVVAGFCQAGLFKWSAHSLCAQASSSRALGAILIALSFFSSMLITNDVALLTFVPFAVIVLGLAHQERELIYVVVLQTVAANLGSMLTPVGNPQNLYLHSFYNIANGDFFATTFPVWLVSLVLLALLCLLLPSVHTHVELGSLPSFNKSRLPLYTLLFIICLLVVFRLMPWYAMLATVVLALAIFNRQLLRQADFYLLLTFVFFFIFAGNLANLNALSTVLHNLIAGHEYLTGLLCSQVISNVPAALLLSSFTNDAKSLLLGVDIGGLGTPVASLASLISLKIYANSPGANVKRFLGVFTLVNVSFLLLMSLLFT